MTAINDGMERASTGRVTASINDGLEQVDWKKKSAIPKDWSGADRLSTVG
jgi:hypothetical protein